MSFEIPSHPSNSFRFRPANTALLNNNLPDKFINNPKKIDCNYAYLPFIDADFNHRYNDQHLHHHHHPSCKQHYFCGSLSCNPTDLTRNSDRFCELSTDQSNHRSRRVVDSLSYNRCPVNEPQLFRIKQRSSSASSQFPKNKCSENLPDNINNATVTKFCNPSNPFPLKNGVASTPSSPYFSHSVKSGSTLNRSMSGKFVARISATNNGGSIPTPSASYRVDNSSPNFNQLPSRYKTNSSPQHSNSAFEYSSSSYKSTPSSLSSNTNIPLSTTTVLPVYYQKDAFTTPIPNISVIKVPEFKRNGSLLSNSAYSRVGSASAIITGCQTPSSTLNRSQNNEKQPDNYPGLIRYNQENSFNFGYPAKGSIMSSETYHDPNERHEKPKNNLSSNSFSVANGIEKTVDSSQVLSPRLVEKSIKNGNEYLRNEKDLKIEKSDQTENISASKKLATSLNQFLNSNRLMNQLKNKNLILFSAENQTNKSMPNNNRDVLPSEAQKSILVNRKKFAYPASLPYDGISSSSSNFAPPKKTVTFAN